MHYIKYLPLNRTTIITYLNNTTEGKEIFLDYWIIKKMEKLSGIDIQDLEVMEDTYNYQYKNSSKHQNLIKSSILAKYIIIPPHLPKSKQTEHSHHVTSRPFVPLEV